MMRNWISCLTLVLTVAPMVQAQRDGFAALPAPPPPCPSPTQEPGAKLEPTPKKVDGFDARKLRDVVAFPFATIKFPLSKFPSNGDDDYSEAFINKQFRGDDRDAMWLRELGRAIASDRPAESKLLFEKSLVAFRRLVEKEPNVAEHRHGMAYALRSLDDWDGSAACLHKCVALDPRFADGWLSLRDHHIRRLLDRFPGLNEINPFEPSPSTPLALDEAERAAAQADIAKAREASRRWRELTPNDLVAAIHGAKTMNELDAIECSINPRRLAPDALIEIRARQLSEFVDRLHDKGRELKAPSILTHAAVFHVMIQSQSKVVGWESNPSFSSKLDRLLESLESCRIGADEEVRVEVLYGKASVAMLFSDTKPKEFARLALEALNAAPTEAAFLMLATCSMSDDVEVISFFEKHVRVHPSILGWMSLGRARHRKGQHKEAIDCFLEARRIDGTSALPHLDLAAAYLKRGGDYLPLAAKSLAEVEKLIAEEPERKKPRFPVDFGVSDIDAHRYLSGVCFALTGKVSEGRIILEKLSARRILPEAVAAALHAIDPVNHLPPPPVAVGEDATRNP